MNLRRFVAAPLPEGAFLRRDRGNALYITNAPSKGWTGMLDGFSVEQQGMMARLSILPEMIEKCDYAPDSLAFELERFRGVSQDAAAIFTECVKCIEAPEQILWEKCDRNLRQAAAAAMRSGCGEGLYYCALALAEAKRRLNDKQGG